MRQGIPLLDNEERQEVEKSVNTPQPAPPHMHSYRNPLTKTRIPKFEHTSDTDSVSDVDNYHPKMVKKSPTGSILNESSHVGEVLSHVVQQQAEMHQKNLEVMQSLMNHSTNSFILDDVPMFDGLKGSIDFEQWLLELDKAAEITGMTMLQLAFSKSTGTPHRMIKRLQKDKSWLYIKEKLQITYAKLATDVHASTDLNLIKRRGTNPWKTILKDFIRVTREQLMERTQVKPEIPILLTLLYVTCTTGI